MKIYISTPINGRLEDTFEEKYSAAKARVEELKQKYYAPLAFKDVITTFDINPLGISEAEALGRCVQAVMECDEILMDTDWASSKGCSIEFAAALYYGKTIWMITPEEKMIKKIPPSV